MATHAVLHPATLAAGALGVVLATIDIAPSIGAIADADGAARLCHHGDARHRRIFLPCRAECRGRLLQPVPLFQVLKMSSGFGLLAAISAAWFLIGSCLLAVPMAVQMTHRPRPHRTSKRGCSVPRRAAAIVCPMAHTAASNSTATSPIISDSRTELIRAHGALRYAVTLPTDLRVIIGRDSWLFLNGDGTIEQATGRLLREPAIAKFADRAAALQTRLQAKKARFLVAIPPNGSTINRFRLPAWAADKPAVVRIRSDDDALLPHAASRSWICGRRCSLPIRSIRPTAARIRTGTSSARLSPTTPSSMPCASLSWAIDPDRVLRGFETVPGGDLARLLAVSAEVSDEEARIDLSLQSAACTVKTSIRSSKAVVT